MNCIYPSGKEWFTASELTVLRLLGVPQYRQGVEELALQECWKVCRPCWSRQREGNSEDFEYHFYNLPYSARRDLAERVFLLSPPPDEWQFPEDVGNKQTARRILVQASDVYRHYAGWWAQDSNDYDFASLYNDNKLSIVPAWVQKTIKSVSRSSLYRWRQNLFVWGEC